MTSSDPRSPEGPESVPADAVKLAYRPAESRANVEQQERRRRIASLILRYVQADGTSKSDAIKAVADATGRSVSTVKNWLLYHLALPDLEAMAQIVARWSIPAFEVFECLSQQPKASPVTLPPRPSTGLPDNDLGMLVPLSSIAHPSLLRALRRYSDSPDHLVIQQFECPDSPVVSHGELMFIDTSVETVLPIGGTYVLSVLDPDGRVQLHTRRVQPLIGRPSAQVAMLSPDHLQLTEEFPLVGGVLAGGKVRVFGKVVAVVKSLP